MRFGLPSCRFIRKFVLTKIRLTAAVTAVTVCYRRGAVTVLRGRNRYDFSNLNSKNGKNKKISKNSS
jgi:hypothetical protein